jgi:N-dimethylarginine dimethylaminohydrolase
MINGAGVDVLTQTYGGHSMVAPLRRVLVHIPDEEYTADAWRAYGLEGEPDLTRAVREHEHFVDILRDNGIEVEFLLEHTSIQTTATYDPALVTDAGAVMLQSGRAERRAEVMPMARRLLELGIPIIGWLREEAYLDAGDTLWLDPETLLVGRSYRSNEAGYRQLRHALDGIVPNFDQFELPHWRGPAYVLHLMSILSLVSESLAVVYARAMPIRLRELLLDRGFDLIEVPDEEFDTQGCNVLALTPNRVVICAGNPITSGRLRDAGVDVLEYEGHEISVRRISGPTCNTRPLLRG